MLAKPCLFLALASLSPLATAQEVKKIIRKGDSVPGMGAFMEVDHVAVNDSGRWIAAIDTDFGDARTDEALLGGEGILLREDAPVPYPPGAAIDNWASLTVGSEGDIGMAVSLELAFVGDADACYWNSRQAWLKGDPIESPVLGAASSFDLVRRVESRGGSLYVLGALRNPQWPGLREFSVVRFDAGTRSRTGGSEVLVTGGMTLPGLGIVVQNHPDGPYSFAVNSHGNMINVLRAVTPSRWEIAIDLERSLAVQDEASPIPGRTWSVLVASSVAINDRGEHAYTGILDGLLGDDTRFLIVKNGQKFVQGGDILPLFQDAPWEGSFRNSEPLVLTDNGDVFWRAQGVNDAYMRNDVPIVQANRTLVGGELVTTAQAGFAVSPNGRFFICQASLQGNRFGGTRSAILMVDFGPQAPKATLAETRFPLDDRNRSR